MLGSRGVEGCELVGVAVLSLGDLVDAGGSIQGSPGEVLGVPVLGACGVDLYAFVQHGILAPGVEVTY